MIPQFTSLMPPASPADIPHLHVSDTDLGSSNEPLVTEMSLNPDNSTIGDQLHTDLDDIIQSIEVHSEGDNDPLPDVSS
jgi:hypothetical protein